MKYETIPIKTEYIKPGDGYDELIFKISQLAQDDDYIIISETPISTAENNLVNESEYTPGILAYLLCDLWSKYLWGYILAPLFGYKKRTIKNLRQIPKQARNHKQFILKEYGLKHALQPTAEAGVDLSNVPGEYVSLLPVNPQKSAQKIKDEIKKRSNINVNVIIIDTDPVYKFRNTLFTTLPISHSDIKNNTGIFGYLMRIISEYIGPSILASTTKDISIENLIKLGSIAEEVEVKYSDNFFETIYNMKDEFKCDFDNVTVEMLDTINHIPGVIIRCK
ncbi:coenzyme F420-0:L-glutamate ligase [Methanosphaera cuniculi]|uniref:Coenzyme F420:L-glutamate ligase n=1 Tax=Methanosphaera cuniculi TaxID=1077256 RepID=A0A2A2HE40_9EURY|nr:coenzyme F420-0:L-glutamate ligase [Methanosphaera cuniculi]PAV07692.1 hypothetical protein ASJ82_00770 [Methanosphaera cuniculi]PWL08242.1 coenzyme F420:L-glutamate ligase [Methanosphaera cuniculi]